MVFVNYKQNNLAKGQLFAWISAAQTTLTLKSGEGDLFPSTFPFLLKLEKYDSTSSLENKPVLKREIVKCTGKSWDILTIERAVEDVPADETATTQTSTAYSFAADDYVYNVTTAGDIKDVKDEITRINNSELPAKLDITTFQAGTPTYNASSGGTDAYAISLSPALTAYTDGMTLQFRADVVNNWSATFNVNWLWAKTIKKEWIDIDLDSGDIEANQIVAVTYNQAADIWQMQSNYGQVIAPPTVSKITDNTYLPWEALTAGEYVFVESPVAEADATNNQNIWDVAGNTRVSFPVFGSGTASDTIKLALAVQWSPSVDLWIRIETDNDGSPSGTLADADAIWSIVAWDLTWSLTTKAISIWENVDKSTWVTYDTSDSITYKTWYKVSFDKSSKINTVTKDSSCTATTCYILDSSWNILDTQSFSWDVATFNYFVSATDYYIVVDSWGSAYTSESKVSVAFPIDSDVVDYDWGIKEAIETSNSLSTSSHDPRNATGKSWVKISPISNCYIYEVTKNLAFTKVYICDESLNVLESADFIWNVATLNNPVLLETWNNYYVLWDAEWATYQAPSWDWSYPTFPITETSISVLAAYKVDWDESRYSVWISWIDTRNQEFEYEEDTKWYNISSMNVVDSISLIEWVKHHVVVFQGTYWSETVNASNFYSIGYSTNDTTTRGAKLYNTSRSAVDTDKRIYTSSDLFTNKLLSKTSALYTYKVDRFWSVNETVAIGTKPNVIMYWIDPNQTGKVFWETQYLSDTPWTIQNSAWSNSVIVGRAISATKVMLQNAFNR